MPRANAAKTVSAPRTSHHSRLLFSRVKNSAAASGAESGFSSPSLGQRTTRTSSLSTQRENHFGTQLRGPRRRLFRLPAIVIIGLIVLLVAAVIFIARPGQTTLVMGSQRFNAEVADTDRTRTNGLSNRANLSPNGAMLFVFKESLTHCFWMKDMKFPLDIVWADANRKVIHIKENLRPDSYPQTFCPSQAARYVVEVNAGAVRDTGLSIGDQLSF